MIDVIIKEPEKITITAEDLYPGDFFKKADSDDIFINCGMISAKEEIEVFNINKGYETALSFDTVIVKKYNAQIILEEASVIESTYPKKYGYEKCLKER